MGNRPITFSSTQMYKALHSGLCPTCGRRNTSEVTRYLVVLGFCAFFALVLRYNATNFDITEWRSIIPTTGTGLLLTFLTGKHGLKILVRVSRVIWKTVEEESKDG